MAFISFSAFLFILELKDPANPLSADTIKKPTLFITGIVFSKSNIELSLS